jgi:hypothetical protein
MSQQTKPTLPAFSAAQNGNALADFVPVKFENCGRGFFQAYEAVEAVEEDEEEVDAAQEERDATPKNQRQNLDSKKARTKAGALKLYIYIYIDIIQYDPKRIFSKYRGCEYLDNIGRQQSKTTGKNSPFFRKANLSLKKHESIVLTGSLRNGPRECPLHPNTGPETTGERF